MAVPRAIRLADREGDLRPRFRAAVAEDRRRAAAARQVALRDDDGVAAGPLGCGVIDDDQRSKSAGFGGRFRICCMSDDGAGGVPGEAEIFGAKEAGGGR